LTISTFKLGKREYVIVPRKDFDRMEQKSRLLSDDDAADLAESLRRLKDPAEKRIPWEQVKKRAGLR
jgi:hypothetical protein